MLFIITKTTHDEAPHGVLAPHFVDRFDWTLHKVAKGEPTEAVAQSVESYPTEKDARSAVAAAKIALRGARFAKVRVSA